ncbi:hypothetical protein SGR_253 [Streptomyces griseus subsp. griseus NBRC 13350]|uniref:Uncharacterized protein n=1 Tax=Streptomyces griseus subsp. griseus (strain JCM 4626 / CBS 651.72 / NBRC 13350 / KCC S-0626 / ISP 5235) TaxID=455632 RepID=B1VNQ9_STRGG|nr:hypothetical protein SGR_253 [Streptomyces griseus subsp. griseus NBRC 13350]
MQARRRRRTDGRRFAGVAAERERALVRLTVCSSSRDPVWPVQMGPGRLDRMSLRGAALRAVRVFMRVVHGKCPENQRCYSLVTCGSVGLRVTQ